jgi:hypothetical protein
MEHASAIPSSDGTDAHAVAKRDPDAVAQPDATVCRGVALGTTDSNRPPQSAALGASSDADTEWDPSDIVTNNLPPADANPDRRSDADG